MGELLLEYNDKNTFLNAIKNYEINNGSYIRNGCTIHSHWMHIKSRDYSQEIICDLLSLNTQQSDSNVKYYIRDGMCISQNRNGFRNNLIICQDTIESHQWALFLQARNIDFLLIRGKRKTLPEKSVYVVPKKYYHMFKGRQYFRIIFYYSFEDKSFVFESSIFSYSICTFSLIYQWQRFQAITLNLKQQEYIELPNLIALKTSERRAFFFDYWDFPIDTINTNDLSQCPVCLEQQRDLLRLECKHNICLDCLKTNYYIGNNSRCALCRGRIAGSSNIRLLSNTLESSQSTEDCLKSAQAIINNERFVLFDKNSKKNEREFVKFQQCIQRTLCFKIDDEFPLVDFSDVQYVLCDYSNNETTKISFVNSILKSFYKISRTKPLNIILIYSSDNIHNIWKKVLENYF